MGYSYDRTAAVRIPSRMSLTQARKVKVELHASLGEVELEILRRLATRTGDLWGNPGSPHVVVTDREIVRKTDSIGRIRTKVNESRRREPWGRTVSMMERAGWLRHSDNSLPGSEPFGPWWLTDGAKTALRAMGEGKPPLIDFRLRG